MKLLRFVASEWRERKDIRAAQSHDDVLEAMARSLRRRDEIKHRQVYTLAWYRARVERELGPMIRAVEFPRFTKW